MKAFVEEVGNVLGIPRRDLIEKDVILHRLLRILSEDDFFSTNFLFKGGTCLTKSYLGYYRFSEDVDFTWADQKVFEGLTQKGIRRELSKRIDDVGSILERTGKGVHFVNDKSDRKYVEIGGSDKTVTYKLWYDSEILKHEAFVKVQINFVDRVMFPPEKGKLKSLISGASYDELERLFPEEYREYHDEISLPVYDIREILAEKVRSILTRRGVKARDFVDVYLIGKTFGTDVHEVRSAIVEKTAFILNLYQKYRENFDDKMNLLESESLFEWGGERELLLQEIDEREFYGFVEEFTDFLKGIPGEMR